MKYKEYHAPASLSEAQNLLRCAGEEGIVIAGATSHPFLGGKDPKIAVDLHRAGLAGICPDQQAFVIGAMTSVAALETFRARGWVLHRVARRFVSQQIRNQSTLGGNLVRVFPWSDFPVALIALEASFVIAGESSRSLNTDDYFATQPAKHFAIGDVLKSIHVPILREGQGFGYQKMTRVQADFSQMTVAVRLTVARHQVTDARVVVGAGLPMPTRLSHIEEAVIGQPATERHLRSVAENPLGEKRARTVAGMSPEYVQQLARVAVGDALMEAAEEAQGAAL